VDNGEQTLIPGKVIGRVVPAHKVESLKGVKFLIVDPIDEEKEPLGKPIVVCDAIGANVGEYVFIAQGTEATFPLPEAFNPSDMTIIAIIDEVTS